MQQKYTEKYIAINLRKQGKSYSEILKKINVSKSTLSIWLRDIPLTQEQKQKLQGRNKSRYLASKIRQKKRIELTRQIIENSKNEIKSNIKNTFFIAGLMLYWAEGTKRGEEMICLSNSDPAMIKFMMLWFRKICKVPENKFRIQIHIHSLHNKKNTKIYWSNITKIKLNQFHKLIIKKTTLKHRKNRLYYGTCNIRICDRNLFRKIMGWQIGFLETFGINSQYKIPK